MGIDVRPGAVAAAIATVLGGDAWLIGLVWGGEDGAALLGLGASLIVVGALLLAASWPTRVRRPVRPRAGAPALGRG